jgi:hypothetical protein
MLAKPEWKRSLGRLKKLRITLRCISVRQVARMESRRKQLKSVCPIVGFDSGNLEPSASTARVFCFLYGGCYIIRNIAYTALLLQIQIFLDVIMLC